MLGSIGRIELSHTHTHTNYHLHYHVCGENFSLVADRSTSSPTAAWVFFPTKGRRVVDIATRPALDPIASIGQVLGDRTVKYKYLNPNTLACLACSHATLATSIREWLEVR